MAEEAAGFVKGITEFRVAGIPVGGVAVGLLVSGLVDGVVGVLEGAIKKELPVWLAKGGGAYAVYRWLPRGIFGEDGAKFATAILAVDAIQDLWDVRGLTRGLFGKAGIGGLVGEEAEGEIPEVEVPPELLGKVKAGKVIIKEEGARRGMF